MISAAQVAAARTALMAGEVAIVPTDTVYGLAAALDSPTGVQALYALKGRARSQPCQVLVYSERLLAQALVPLDALTSRVVRALLPGPTTCIVPDPTGRYGAATGDRPGTVGLRAPLMTGAILDLDIPLVATSANDPGAADPAAVSQIAPRLREGAFVLDAGVAPGTSSAVIDLCQIVEGGAARLIRPGRSPETVIRALQAAGVSVADG